jgi:hypothetical protein
MTTHRTLTGDWAACVDGSCPLLFHFDISVADAETMPKQVMLQLMNVIDPPQEITSKGVQHWLDEKGRHHRDYDLPAQINPNGEYLWYQHGVHHRADDKPGLISDIYGVSIWYVRDEEGRANDLPSRIFVGGQQEWRRDRLRHRDDGPAVIYADGQQDYWVNGEYVMTVDREGRVIG